MVRKTYQEIKNLESTLYNRWPEIFFEVFVIVIACAWQKQKLPPNTNLIHRKNFRRNHPKAESQYYG